MIDRLIRLIDRIVNRFTKEHNPNIRADRPSDLYYTPEDIKDH